MSIANTDIDIYPDGRMDTRSAALYTGYTEKTLAIWRCRGKGPRFVKPGRVFYYKDDIDQWLKSKKKGNEPWQII